MQQKIQFVTAPDGVIAVATPGRRHPLIMIPGWIGHLELEWEAPPLRDLVRAPRRIPPADPVRQAGHRPLRPDITDYPGANLPDLEAIIGALGLKRPA